MEGIKKNISDENVTEAIKNKVINFCRTRELLTLDFSLASFRELFLDDDARPRRGDLTPRHFITCHLSSECLLDDIGRCVLHKLLHATRC